MAFASKTLAAVAFLALLPLGACATEAAGRYAGPQPQGQGYDVATVTQTRLTPPESHDGLLSSPPNDARPGECYAKVVVPGQPIGAPPAQPRAVWVQTPPGPGQVTPTWCIYYLPGAQPQPVAMTPERFGWIRVVCDKDATEEKIRHVQRRLHAWGDYNGAYDGHFDGATAQGVVRFQEQRHIEHGGYLSVRTVDALDGAPPPAPGFNPYTRALNDMGPPAPPAPPIFASSVYKGYPQTAPQPSFEPPAPPMAYAPPPAPSVVYAPPSPPQVMVQRVIQPIYVPQPQPVYAPPPPPQVVVQREIQPIYVPQPQPVYAPPSPPQVVVQRVVQPVYIQQQPVYAPQPQFQQQMACGQPACMAPAPSPCGVNACGGQGGGYWGGGYGQPGGAPPYRALLTWSGKSTY